MCSLTTAIVLSDAVSCHIAVCVVPKISAFKAQLCCNVTPSTFKTTSQVFLFLYHSFFIQCYYYLYCASVHPQGVVTCPPRATCRWIWLYQNKITVPYKLPHTDYSSNDHSACRCNRFQRGGRANKSSTAQFLSDFLDPYGQQVEVGESYHYVDHTDDIGLLAYPKDTYIFATIPLRDLLTQITLSQARIVMKLHDIPCGSRDCLSAIESRLENHSGLCCARNKLVFIKSLRKVKSPAERKKRMKSQKDQITSGTSPKTSHSNIDSCPSVEFPPVPLDKDLSGHIIGKACSQMNTQNINETGCAVCGELKPLHGMSRLKAVKQQLDILVASGVSRIERKKSSSALREYQGPRYSIIIVQ